LIVYWYEISLAVSVCPVKISCKLSTALGNEENTVKGSRKFEYAAGNFEISI
jgi:hypothetical protein